MKRLLVSCALALPLVALTATASLAEVKSREKSQVKFEGMLGRAIGMFGGKAAKEGVVSTTAVKGDRKATMNDTDSRIVDLSEEKIYEIDMKGKTYKVKTFDELRAELRKAREEAEKQAQKAREEAEKQKSQKEEKPEAPTRSGKEVEVDFDVKETGQKKSLAGYETREVVMTVTVREKGKTLEDAGGLMVTADSWVAPSIPALEEVADFELRFWKQLQGTDTMGLPPEQMAMVLAQYPMIKDAMERLQKEGGSKLNGTPLATTTTFEAVKSKAQMAQPAKTGDSGGGGLGGFLAKKMMKKDAGEAKARSVIFTIDSEVQEVATSVSASDLEVPAGFKEKK